MSFTKSFVMVAIYCLVSAGLASAEQHQPPRKKMAGRPEIVTLEQEAPARPPTPEQMPAAAPQVTFQNGMLTIVSQNSTLGDILRAVHTHTGAIVDIPSNATERVVAKLGPGPARDVLASLLNGTHFNYVMLGSISDAHALDRVILTPKSATPVNNTASAEPAPAPPAEADEEASDDSDDADDSDDEDTTQADEGESGNEDQAQQVQPVGQGQPGLPNVRTPEQMLQQLRQQQMQQQQGQPGQTGAPQGQPFPGPNQPVPNPPN
jgi:hypothetical protein